MPREFDQFAENYDELVRDPVKDAIASNYQFFHWRKWNLLEGFFARTGWNTGELSWLDVGCGQGELLRLGKSRFLRVSGCDPSAEMLKRSEGIHVRQQDSPAEIPYEEASQDLVTAVCVYHHVKPELRRALTVEIGRVLKPGGVFCIFEHNPLNPLTWLIVRRAPVDADAELLTARTAKSILRDSGFRVLGTEYFLYLPETLYARIGAFERLLTKVPFGGQYAVFGRR